MRSHATTGEHFKACDGPTDAQDIGNVHRYSSAPASRSKVAFVAFTACSPGGLGSANTAIFAPAAAGPNSGSVPS